MINNETIDQALNNIASLIEIQATDGSQTKEVQTIDKEAYSIGQFIDNQPRDQRGIHGTSSGLLVLAEIKSNNTIINGLVKYLENHSSIETELIKAKGDTSTDRLTRDENNVIKIAETLIALSQVTQAQSKVEAYKEKLSKKLMSAIYKFSGETGLQYFTDSNHESPPELLPTAFAILALSKLGYRDEIKDSVALTEYKLKNEKITDPSRFAILVFSLYALVYSYGNLSDSQVTSFKKIFKRLWANPFCSLANNYEQNLEYWYNNQHDYVRIPWQMYLITIAARFSPWKFYTFNCQRRVSDMVNEALGSGFKYPFSGRYVSTRTNSILFQCLIQIKENLKTSVWYWLWMQFDRFRLFLGSSRIKFWVKIFGWLLFLYIVYVWFKPNGNKLSEVAPELLAYSVINLLGKKNAVH
jgi:hypothetical protein